MTGNNLETLDDVRKRLDELIDERGPDREVHSDADGVLLDGVRIDDTDERTVFY
jgi:hypothetical protein